MITSLFGLASDKEPANEKNNNGDQTDLKPQLQTSRTEAAAETQTDSRRLNSTPANLDQLSRVAHELLMDRNLEVSKVRPFFWSMVETYLDRFQVYPFDVVKALFSYLESRDYPEDQVRDLVDRLERSYQRQHGESLRQATPSPVEQQDSLEDELKELRESLKYAALVDDLEDQR